MQVYHILISNLRFQPENMFYFRMIRMDFCFETILIFDKKTMGKTIIIIMAAVLATSIPVKEETIKESVLTELRNYPEASLADIYKNFFQDAYGPGHLIPDTTQAGAYLDEEMEEPLWGDTVKWQPLGSNHDFYRVNLSLVKEGVIPRDVLLGGMVKSAPLARKPGIKEWEEEWAEVLEVVKEMNLNLPGFEADKKAIGEKLARGEVVAHHSNRFTETYHPHYRIVHKSVFEGWKKKYLKN
jgi:hypothetical protein